MNSKILLLTAFILSFSLIIGAATSSSVGIAGQPIIYTNIIVQNTIYQNTNSVPLTIYATMANAVAYTQETAWIGNTPTFTSSNFLQVANIIPTSVSETLGTLTQQPAITTFTITVPPGWYFTFNGFAGSYNSFIFQTGGLDSFPVTYNTPTANQIGNKQFSVSLGFLILIMAVFAFTIVLMAIMLIPYLTEKLRKRK